MVSPKTRAILWARGAGRCHICNQILIGDYLTGNEDANFGFVAHIVAEQPGGPRGDAIRSPLLADDVQNLMLLCHKHHKLIDVDEVANYPEQLLLDIKAAHEARIEVVSDITPDKASHVLRYGAKIGIQESPVSFSRVRIAMLPMRYPADGRAIGIEIKGSVATDGDDNFWASEPANLRQQFERMVRAAIAAGEISHLSVFALAPIPLLIELGNLLGDILPADVYQLHREPAGWTWAEDGVHLDFALRHPQQIEKTVALKVGISAGIADERVLKVLGPNVSIWDLTVPAPHNDAMRYPGDLRDFRRTMRAAFDAIKDAHSEQALIHMFPAVPVSVAVEIGRVRMPKADLPILVYDQIAERGFVPRLRIG